MRTAKLFYKGTHLGTLTDEPNFYPITDLEDPILMQELYMIQYDVYRYDKREEFDFDEYMSFYTGDLKFVEDSQDKK